ncbi:MAG: hypothetical protein HY718_10875 [Planctomycetes bacterium]|nr:hypothetical protein [Planctomycetota bacterium]
MHQGTPPPPEPLPSQSGNPADQRNDNDLPAPSITYLGPVAVWGIPKPRGPRMSVRTAAIGWLLLAPVLLATLLWVHTESRTLWPFGRRATHMSEVVLRYELIAAVCWCYLTGMSLPIWLRHRRLARQDVWAIDAAIRAEQWERAGLFLHRYCLLVSGIWRKLPARAAVWDAVLRNHLPRHRRLYVYYRQRPPTLPPDPMAGFTITVIRPPRPSPWSAAGLVPVALLLYLLLVDVVRHRDLHQAFLFNTVLLAIVLVSYTAYFAMALLGRSSFYRFAPGIMQYVRYRALRRRPTIESYDLRRLHLVLDLCSPWPGLTLLNTPRYRREVYCLPRGPEAVEAVFRAALSTVPSPPLPEDQLVD